MITREKGEAMKSRHLVIVTGIGSLGIGLALIPLLIPPPSSLFVVATLLTCTGIAGLLVGRFKGYNRQNRRWEDLTMQERR